MQKQAFSMLEMVILMAIVTIFSIIAIPSFIKVKYNLDLKGTARSISVALITAKTKSFRKGPIAIDFSDPHHIKICLDNNRNRLCEDNIFQVLKIDQNISLNINNNVYFERGLPKNPSGGFGADTIIILHAKTNKCFKVIYNRVGRIRINEC